jgi:hypothetical protein
VDQEAGIIENFHLLKENNDEVYLNAMNNMMKGLSDPNYLDAEFTVYLDDEP